MTDNQEIIHHRTTLAQTFLNLRLDKDVRIIDVACGTGIVAEELRSHGYTNIDGLDPVEGYLQVAQSNHLYKKVFKSFIDERVPTPIEDDTYDVMICCAGFFQSLISPKAFPELIRITKKGGILLWNQMEGYNSISATIPQFDESIQFLIDIGRWSPIKIIRCDLLRFSDCGSAYLRGLESSGVTAPGFVFIMAKLT